MISLLVPDISPCDGFCEKVQRRGEELGILVVRFIKKIGDLDLDLQKITFHSLSYTDSFPIDPLPHCPDSGDMKFIL